MAHRLRLRRPGGSAEDRRRARASTTSSSVAGFWRSTCALMRVADEHGGADCDTRSMIHTIGVSFTAEMAVKAAYEETIGRATAWMRGRGRRRRTGDRRHGDRLRRVPAPDALVSVSVHARNRRSSGRRRRTASFAAGSGGFGIGLEFAAKAAYARVIGGAVAATAPAQADIRSVVSGLAEATSPQHSRGDDHRRARGRHRNRDAALRSASRASWSRSPRRGGTMREIAGNDDIMVTLTVPIGAAADLPHGTGDPADEARRVSERTAARGREGRRAGGVPQGASARRSRPRTRLRLLNVSPGDSITGTDGLRPDEVRANSSWGTLLAPRRSHASRCAENRREMHHGALDCRQSAPRLCVSVPQTTPRVSRPGRYAGHALRLRWLPATWSHAVSTIGIKRCSRPGAEHIQRQRNLYVEQTVTLPDARVELGRAGPLRHAHRRCGCSTASHRSSVGDTCCEP